MRGNADIRVAERLQEPDLLAVQRDDSIEPLIDEEDCDEQEYCGQSPAHVPEHVEAMFAPRVRRKILPAIGGLTAIRVE